MFMLVINRQIRMHCRDRCINRYMYRQNASWTRNIDTYKYTEREKERKKETSSLKAKSEEAQS